MENALATVPPDDKALDAAVSSLRSDTDRAHIAANLDSALDVNPDAAARTQQLAQKTGTPLALVEGREAEVEREYQMRTDRIDKINKRYPALREMLKDPDFVTISHDEIDHLAQMEDAAPVIMNGESSTFDDIAGGFEQTASAHAVLGLAYDIGDPRQIAEFIARNERLAQDRAARYPGYVRDFTRQRSMAADGWDVLGAVAENPRGALRVYGSQMPGQMALPLAGGLAGGAVGGAAGTAVPVVGNVAGGIGGFAVGTFSASLPGEVGSWMIQALQERGVDMSNPDEILKATSSPEFKNELRAQAERKGLTTAAINAALSPLQGKFISAAKGTGARNVAKALGKEAAVSVVSNAGSEAVGQAVGYGDISKVNTADVAEEAIVGLGMSAGESVAGFSYRKPLRDIAQEVAADKTAQMDAAHSLVRESKLAQRNPDMLKALVEKAAPGQEVYVDGAAGVEFFQSLPPEKQNALLGVIPDLKDKLAEAEVAGTDVGLSKADYFAYIAPHAESDALKEHIRFGQDDFTVSQLNAIDDIVDEAMADIEREPGQDFTAAEEMQRRIETELMNAGRTPEVARLEGLLARANQEALTARYGGNDVAQAIIDDAYRNLSVRARQKMPFYKRKVDDLDLLIDSARSEATGNKRAPALPAEKKYPVLNRLKEMGGVRKGSDLHAELEAMGVTNKTLPGLIRRGEGRVLGMFGMQGEERAAIDNIPASEWNLSDAPPQDGNGYVDKQFVLDAVREELGGKPIKKAGDYADARPEDALRDELDRLGVDIATASNEEVRAALNNAAAADRAAEELFQGTSDEPRGSIQFYPDGKTIINIFEGADLSTVIHELGHFYWNLFDNLNEAKVLNESGAKDWRAIRDFVGAKEGETLNVDQEEKIARAFEAYIMEGKAPSLELEGAFQRFKAWLTRIYRVAANLDVRLTNEVRAVFDRMLATDEAISIMQENKLFRPDDAVLAILNEQQKEAYLRQGERAIQTAKDKLFRKTMRELERSKTKWWKEETERVRAEMEAQVDASPVYQVLNAMQRSLLPDGSEMEAPLRLSRKELREQFGEEIFKYMPKGTIAKTEAEASSPAIVAEMFGFNSPDSMVKAIINAPDRKAKIEALTESEMRERHGDIMTDGTLEREAMEAFHSADRAAMLATELKTVADIAGVGAATPDQFRAAAERIIAAKKIDDAIKPSRFYYAEVRSSREFGRALARKDYVAAADAKRKQLLNHYLYRLSRDADSEVQKILKRFAKLQKPPVKGRVKIDEDYHNKIREILAAYGFGARMSARRELKLELEAIAQWMQAKEADDSAELTIPLEIEEARNKTHFRDMTLNEFRALRDMVYNIETQGRRKLEYTLNGQQRAFEEVKQELLAAAEESGPIVPRALNPSPLGQFRDKFFAMQTKAREYFRRLDSGNMQGKFHDAIISDIDKGIDRLNVRLKDAADKFRNLLEASYSREELAKMANHKFQIDGLGDGFTHENLLMMALNWGNEENRRALLHGDGWDHAVVDRILKERLTAKDWQFVQGVWDWFNSYWPEASALERRRRGFTPPKVEALPFTTPHGEMRGGYFPISADPRRGITAREQTIDQMAKEMRGMSYAATRQGHLKARVGVGLDQRPLNLQMSVISRHVAGTLRDIELGEPIHQASRLLRNRDIKNAIVDRLGIEAYSTLDLWLKDVAVGDMGATDAISMVMDKLRSNATIAYMGFSLSTFVQQGSGLTQTAAVLGSGGRGWKWVALGVQRLMKAYANGPAMTIHEIHDVSEFMRMRHQTFSRDIKDTMDLIHGSRASKISVFGKYLPPDYRKWFLFHIQKAQEIVDAISWLGAQAKAEAEGMEPARAIKYADDVVRSQASGLIQDLSAMERGSFSNSNRFNKFTKLFTFMFSYWNAKYNVASGKYADLRAGRLSAGAYAVDMINLIWVEALLSSFLTGTLPGQTDDEDSEKDRTKDWAWWTLKQPLSIMPFGRDIQSGLEGLPPTSTPVGAAIKAAGTVAQQAGQGEADVAAVKSVVNLTGLLVGIPSSQINRFISMADRAANDKDVGYIDLVRQRKPEER